MPNNKYTDAQRKTIAKAIERAITDADFRQALLNDSEAAIQAEYGTETGAVYFVEETYEADATILIPTSADELTEEFWRDLPEEELSLFRPVIEKAVAEEAYRSYLIAEPKAAIESVTGAELPSHASLRVQVAPGPIARVFRVPPFVEESADLTDADLELVAGGQNAAAAVSDCWASCVCTSCCVSISI